VPEATAVIKPVVDIVATAVLSELHDTGRPVNTAPLAANVVAVACDVSSVVIEVGASVTVTDATGTGTTVTVTPPLTPSLVAVMVAVPGAMAVTRPDVGSTVATAGALELQLMARPVSALPFLSSVVAVA